MASGVVYQAVHDLVTAQWSATPVRWENEAFTPPADLAWGAIELTGTAYAQQTLGAGSAAANRWDEAGILWFHVFVPVGSGSIEARNTAKAFADLFRGRLLLSDTIEFGDAAIGMGQAGDDDGLWWGISTSIEWRRTGA